MTEQQATGWYPDPSDDSAEIYWDGIQWHGRREKFTTSAPPINPTPQPQPTATQSRQRKSPFSLSFSDNDDGDWRSWLGTGRRAPQSETSLRNVFDFGASGKKLNEKRLRIVAIIGLALMVLFIARDCSDRFNGATQSTRPAVTKAPTSAVAPTGWLGTPLPTVLAPLPTVVAPSPTVAAPPPTEVASSPTAVAPSPTGPDKQIDDRLNGLGIDATFTTIQGPEGQEVTAEFDIPENLTEGMIKSGARQDTIDILEYAKATYPNASQVRVTGSYPLTDDYGNTSTEIVINLTYLKSTLDKINFNGVASENIWELADRGYIVPAFRP